MASGRTVSLTLMPSLKTASASKTSSQQRLMKDDFPVFLLPTTVTLMDGRRMLFSDATRCKDQKTFFHHLLHLQLVAPPSCSGDRVALAKCAVRRLVPPALLLPRTLRRGGASVEG